MCHRIPCTYRCTHRVTLLILQKTYLISDEATVKPLNIGGGDKKILKIIIRIETQWIQNGRCGVENTLQFHATNILPLIRTVIYGLKQLLETFDVLDFKLPEAPDNMISGRGLWEL